MFSKLYQKYRYSLILLRELVVVDFKLRYQNSVLGYVWALLRPLFMFVILYLIFAVFLGVGKDIPHWAVALLLGLVMWEFFNEATKSGLKAIVGNGGMIRKINFPKYIIVLSSSISAFINLIINLFVVFGFVLITNAPIGWGYLVIPLYIVELYIFALGCAFILSTVNVKVRDISFIWEVITRGGFYATAVLFPITLIFAQSQLAGQLLLLNPVAQMIQDARHGMLGDIIPSTYTMIDNTLLFIIPFAIVVATFVGGALYFKRRSPYFAEDV